MRSLLVAGICTALPLSAPAQGVADCETFMASRHIPQPVITLPDSEAMEIIAHAMLPVAFDMSRLTEGFEVPAEDMPRGFCSPQQMAMLVTNTDAITNAVPVTDPAALHGTWLSDDTLIQDAGLVVPGQEVLVIGAPDEGDPVGASGIAFRQYWFRAIAPFGGSFWDADGNFAGLVAQGSLHGLEGGSFIQDRIETPIRYSGIDLIDERSDDLFIKSKLNVFDQGVSFALDGDVLVLTYELRMPIYRSGSDMTRTYTRVADDAPQTALRIVNNLALSQAQFFACLTHKISAQDPALTAALAPLSITEFDDLMRQSITATSQRDALVQGGRENGSSEELRSKLVAAVEQEMQLRDQIGPASAVLMSSEGSTLCPKPPQLF